MNQPKLWTKDFIIDILINFLAYIVYYLLIVTIALHAMDSLHASPSAAGLASGIFLIGTLVARTLTGRTIEQFGRRKTLYAGLVFYMISTLFYFGVHNMPMMFLVRFLHGFGFGVAGTATGTIAASIIPSKRRGEGVSYYAMSVTLASAVGPFLGMTLNSRGDFNTILVFSTVILLISLMIVNFLKVPEVTLSPEQIQQMRSCKLDSFIEKKALPIAFVSLFIGLAYASIISFLTSYTRQIHLVRAGSLFFIVYAISILVSRPMTGRCFDRKGENSIMYPAFVLFAVGLTLLNQAHQAYLLLLAAVFVGLGYGTFLSGAQAVAIKVSPQHRFGLATSTLFTFFDGGIGIGPFLLGFLIPSIGLRGMYAMMAVVVLAVTGLYYYVHGRHAQIGCADDVKPAAIDDHAAVERHVVKNKSADIAVR